jgi:hypothetical protein
VAEVQRQQQIFCSKRLFHRKAALSQDNSQWTGVNRLLKPEEIVIQDEEEWVELNGWCHASLFVAMI